MEITTETIIAFIAVIGSILAIWLNSRKLSSDLKTEYATRAVWQASVDTQLESIKTTQSETKIILQEYTRQLSVISEKQLANEIALNQLKQEQAKMWRILDSIRGATYDV